MILWIFPAVIGASLVLAGYLRYRLDKQFLDVAGKLIPARVEARSGRQTSTVATRARLRGH
ncbi:MAG TPA: hypothetical protein VLV81_10635 [Acidimicrobiia bacterium]|nr:hypothetical protein [Acidimicrobiia bacterium]